MIMDKRTELRMNAASENWKLLPEEKRILKFEKKNKLNLRGRKK